MELIKLTNVENSTPIYIITRHLVAFWKENDATYFITTYGDNASGRVKETPKEILEMLDRIEGKKKTKRLMEYA